MKALENFEELYKEEKLSAKQLIQKRLIEIDEAIGSSAKSLDDCESVDEFYLAGEREAYAYTLSILDKREC